MKKHIFGIALATLTLIGCNETPHPVPQTITIDFESASLNEQGISYGADSGRKDATGTYNIYSQAFGGAKLDTWMQTEPYFNWWGWAASHNVGEEYKADYTHQYECPIAAASGENFAVCYFSDYNQTLYRPAIQFAKNVDVNSLKVANSTTVACYVGGKDAYSQWDEGDLLELTIYGYKGGVLQFEKNITLAEGATLLEGWTEVELPRATVNRLEFEISTTDVGDWGVNAPTYVCIDDIKYTTF